jgi:hypothetical protein
MVTVVSESALSECENRNYGTINGRVDFLPQVATLAAVNQARPFGAHVDQRVSGSGG